ncbi:hypothetical protein GT360_06550 [Vibrio astriarenae]|uniref:Uncharacterized protein n=1 Tax=Vibrio astriarenae TaxID=1481923 RepID=A0A7Z2T2K6_9VIBR|nr:hypothetical protein [Vibrio astriarenae]QIA63194.1 hypothetical protein GT360_06550 [Vibrio astriarenae]
MYIKKINDKQIREMMMGNPSLFRGMISTHYHYVDRVRQEMALYEHQANPLSAEQLVTGYLSFREQCEAMPEI